MSAGQRPLPVCLWRITFLDRRRPRRFTRRHLPSLSGILSCRLCKPYRCSPRRRRPRIRSITSRPAWATFRTAPRSTIPFPPCWTMPSRRSRQRTLVHRVACKDWRLRRRPQYRTTTSAVLPWRGRARRPLRASSERARVSLRRLPRLQMPPWLPRPEVPRPPAA